METFKFGYIVISPIGTLFVDSFRIICSFLTGIGNLRPAGRIRLAKQNHSARSPFTNCSNCMARLVVLYFKNLHSLYYTLFVRMRNYLRETALCYENTVYRILGFRCELWKSGAKLNKFPQISKFYQHHQQQRERNFWWKISTARHILQSSFLARD